MEEYVRIVAGGLILIFSILSAAHSRLWLLFIALVGINLLQSAFTHWCLIEKILGKLGVSRYIRFDEGDID